MSIATLGVGAIPRSIEAPSAVTEVRPVATGPAETVRTDAPVEVESDASRVPELTSKSAALAAAVRR